MVAIFVGLPRGAIWSSTPPKSILNWLKRWGGRSVMAATPSARRAMIVWWHTGKGGSGPVAARARRQEQAPVANPEVEELLAQGRQLRGQEALAIYDRAIMLDPGSVEAHSGRASALLDLCRTHTGSVHDDAVIAELELIARLDLDALRTPTATVSNLTYDYLKTANKWKESGELYEASAIFEDLAHILRRRFSESIDGDTLEVTKVSDSDIVRELLYLGRYIDEFETSLRIEYDKAMPDGTTPKPRFDGPMQEVARRYQMSVEKVHAVLEAARAAPAPTVAAREIFGDIPAALQSKAYEKGGFPPEL